MSLNDTPSVASSGSSTPSTSIVTTTGNTTNAAPTTLSNSLLVCGRCRKKTPELVSKLCQTCGVALHPSCSHDVALRECGLGYGFPVSSSFCSKRCYEADLLSNAGTNTNNNTPSSNGGGGAITSTSVGIFTGTPTGAGSSSLHNDKPLKRNPHVPNEITAALTVKIGDVSRTSRKQLSLTTFRFLLSEGFEVFQAKANSRTAKELQNFTGEPHVREDRAIYIKPGVHSKQAELVELTEKNFESRVARSYRNFLKRKPGGNENFECDIVTYVKRDVSRRPHSVRQVIASTNQSPQFMGVSRTHHHLSSPFMDHQQVHNKVGTGGDMNGNSPTLLGDNTTDPIASGVSTGMKRKYAQLQSIADGTSPGSMSANDQANVLDAAVTDNGAYKTVRMIMNGSVVPVKVNVRDLLAAFGMIHPGEDSNHMGGA